MSVIATVLQESVRLTLPYGFAALGGMLAERSGLPHIALEAVLLSSAFLTTWCYLTLGGGFAAVVGGLLGGALVGVLLALLVEKLKVNAILAGLALNLAAAGGARVLLRAVYGSTSNSPTLNMSMPAAVVPILMGLTLLLLVPLLSEGLRRTRFGLQLRAAGEDAARARLVGVDVARVRLFAALIGSSIAGLGGVALVFDQRQFQAQMTGGRGFVALAAVALSTSMASKLGSNGPRSAFLCALLFGVSEAISVVLQARTHFPTEVLHALPYVLTLAVLALLPRLTRLPNQR
jgi:general nucleoside transport system permease protein